jgi:WD40 repeat protein
MSSPSGMRSVSGFNELAFPLLDLLKVEGGRCVEFDDLKGNIFLSACPTQYATVNEWTHGVMMSSVEDTTTRHYLPLHAKPIRDLHFNSPRQMLLSCGFDKTAKLSSVAHGTVVTVFNLPQPAWSCQFSSWNTDLVHIGLQTGELITYDVRQASTPLVSLSLPSKQPVHSIVSIGHAHDDSEAVRGVIAATSAHVMLFKSSPSAMAWDCIDLPVSTIPRMVRSAQTIHGDEAV